MCVCIYICFIYTYIHACNTRVYIYNKTCIDLYKGNFRVYVRFALQAAT